MTTVLLILGIVLSALLLEMGYRREAAAATLSRDTFHVIAQPAQARAACGVYRPVAIVLLASGTYVVHCVAPRGATTVRFARTLARTTPAP